MHFYQSRIMVRCKWDTPVYTHTYTHSSPSYFPRQKIIRMELGTSVNFNTITLNCVGRYCVRFAWSPKKMYNIFTIKTWIGIVRVSLSFSFGRDMAHRTYRNIHISFYLSPHTFIYFIHSDSFSISFPPRYCWVFILFYITLCGLYSIIRVDP